MRFIYNCSCDAAVKFHRRLLVTCSTARGVQQQQEVVGSNPVETQTHGYLVLIN